MIRRMSADAYVHFGGDLHVEAGLEGNTLR